MGWKTILKISAMTAALAVILWLCGGGGAVFVSSRFRATPDAERSAILAELLGIEMWREFRVTPNQSEDLVFEITKNGDPYPLAPRRIRIDRELKDPSRPASDLDNVAAFVCRDDAPGGDPGSMVIEPSMHGGSDVVVEIAVASGRSATEKVPARASDLRLIGFARCASGTTPLFDLRFEFAQVGLSYSSSTNGETSERVSIAVDIEHAEDPAKDPVEDRFEVTMHLEPRGGS